jgi:membrane protein
MQIIKTVGGFFNRMKHDHVGAYAAQAAYFIMLSFIPFIMLLMNLVQYTPINKLDVEIAIIKAMPPAFEGLINTILEEIYTKSFTILSVTAITAIWSSGRGILALTNGLNSICHVDETRNYVLMRLRSAAYTILFIIAIILSLVLLVFGNKIHASLVEYAPFLSKISGFLISVRTVGTITLLTAVFLLMFKILPNRKTKIRDQLPGAIFTACSWTFFSFAFSVYIDNFTGLSYMYGSLTTIVIVMLWLYCCMYLILIGAEVNAFFEDKFIKAENLAVARFKDKRAKRKKADKKG